MVAKGFATPTETSRRRQDLHESFTSGGPRSRSASAADIKNISPRTRRPARKEDTETEEARTETANTEVKWEGDVVKTDQKFPTSPILRSLMGGREATTEGPATFRPLPRPPICGPHPLSAPRCRTPLFPQGKITQSPAETPTFAERSSPPPHFATQLALPRGPPSRLSFIENAITNKQPLRLPKPESFSCKPEQDVEEWIQKMELYLRAHKTTEPDAIAFAVQLLNDHASKWWRAVSRHDPRMLEEWTTFVDQLRRQYVAPNVSAHARSRIAQIRQLRSVMEYSQKFHTFMVDIPGMSVEEALERFMTGLKPHIQTQVRLQRPQNLEAAMADALIVDDCAMLSRRENFDPC